MAARNEREEKEKNPVQKQSQDRKSNPSHSFLYVWMVFLSATLLTVIKLSNSNKITYLGNNKYILGNKQIPQRSFMTTLEYYQSWRYWLSKLDRPKTRDYDNFTKVELY